MADFDSQLANAQSLASQYAQTIKQQNQIIATEKAKQAAAEAAKKKGGAGGCCGRNDRQHHRNGCLDSRHRNDLEYDRKYRFDRDGYLDFGQQYLRQLFHRSDGRRTKSVLHDRSQRQ